MKVWAVMEHWKYEGSSVHSIYACENKARIASQDLNSEENDPSIGFYVEEFEVVE